MFSPPLIRERLIALNCLNYELGRISSSVSDPLLGQIKLKWWHDELMSISNNASEVSGHPLSGILAKFIDTKTNHINVCVSIIAAYQENILSSEVKEETLDSLIQFYTETWGALSKLQLSAVGVEDEFILSVAESIAIGWALMDYIRTTGQRLENGVAILPKDIDKKHNLCGTNIHSAEDNKLLCDGLRTIGLRAETYFQHARDYTAEINDEALPILLPKIIAESYLSSLVDNKFNIFSPRVLSHSPPILKLCWIAWKKTM